MCTEVHGNCGRTVPTEILLPAMPNHTYVLCADKGELHGEYTRMRKDHSRRVRRYRTVYGWMCV